MLVLWCLAFLVVAAVLLTIVTKMLGNSSKMYSRSRRAKLYILVAVVLVIVFLFLLITQRDWLGSEDIPDDYPVTKFSRKPVSAGGQKSLEFYGIMFDAGSTGSRIHVFRLQHDPNGGDGAYKLLDELFLSTKPGLSSYADDPNKAAESLRDMLDKAKAHIPSSYWSNTILGLKATAGLRLLSNKTAQTILDKVLKLFQSFPFKTSANGVSILEGAEEGLFCWFTLNFLQDALKNQSTSVGILDLGGGSTQITYLPDAKSVNKAPKDFLLNVGMLGKKLSMYTHSYLGLGILSLRFQTLGGKESGDAIKPGSFKSVCLPENHSGKWKYGGTEHSIQSTPPLNGSRFESCYAAVRSVVSKYNIHRPEDLNEKQFYALSYFYDRSVDTKLIDSEDGGKVRVSDFLEAAKKACLDSSSTEGPFLCLDLCYISSLLTDGYGFKPSYTFLLKKRVNKIEIAWPLGALFNHYGKFNTIA